MAFDDRPSLRWFHVAALAAIVGLSVHAVRARPDTRLIGQAKVNAGTTLSARDPAPRRSWDMDLRLDSSVRPPGWPWVLHEGKHPGEGYELRWIPDHQVLQVVRTGSGPFLLGSVRLDGLPGRISFQRRGGMFTVLADGGQVLRCIDPDGPLDQGPSSWGCTTTGTLGDATLTVQIVDLPVPQWGSEPAGGATAALRTDGPFLAVAGALRAEGGDEAIARAFGRAREQLGATRNAPDADQQGRSLTPTDRERLRLWLSLARIRWQLAASDPGSEEAFRLVDEEVETLFAVTDRERGQDAAGGNRIPELAGILMSLTEPLARRACTIPPAAMSDRPEVVNDRILDHRRRWLDLLGAVTARTLALTDGTLAPDDLAQVRLLLHAAGCLRSCDGGSPPADGSWSGLPLPVPLDAPSWLVSRWRAFAGGDPAMDALPALPGGGGPVSAAIDLIADYVDLDPLPAVGMRQVILDRLARRDRLLPLGREKDEERRDLEDESLRACDRQTVPLRERALARALVALHLGTSRPSMLRPAREALASTELVRTDPLAFAIDQVLRKRHGELIGTDGSPLPDRARIERFFPEYQVLMDGSAAATARIWRVRLPHAQALAVALLMQEVAGGDPDWSLLERVPGFTLPLPLLAPVRAPAATGGGAAISPGTTVAP